MHAYRDQYASLFRGGRDIVLIGISTDTPEALQSWAEDDEFPFLFASDPESAVGQQYGAISPTSSSRGRRDGSGFRADRVYTVRYLARPRQTQ